MAGALAPMLPDWPPFSSIQIQALAPFFSIKIQRLHQQHESLLFFSPSPHPLSSIFAKMGVEANGVENSNGSPEVKEPLQKIQKLHQNGVDHSNAKTAVPLLRVKKLSESAVLPSRASTRSAGYDLSSATAAILPGRGKALVPTDLSISIPEGTYARIAPRSGLAWKHSIDVGAGVIDADYRGPVGVVLFNHSDVDFEVKPGDRIAQLVIEKIMTPEVLEVDGLDSTERGSGGFGSTGVRAPLAP